VVFEAIRKDERLKDFKCCWALKDPDKFSIDGADIVRMHSIEYFKRALCSGVWIANGNMEKSLCYKQKETFYINLWHGLFTIKTAGNRQVSRSDYDMSRADIFLSCLPEDSEFLVERFNVRKEALRMVGRPIDDELFTVTDAEIKAIRQRYGVLEGKKVILYAPTYRESEFICRLDAPINIEKWRGLLGRDFVVIHHKHHLSRNWNRSYYNEFFIDGNSADSINELYKIADILISDYSSSVYSYCILGRPIVFFLYDFDEYNKQCGVEFRPWEQFNNSTFYDEDSLLAYLSDFDWDKETSAALAMRERFIRTDGHATEFVLNELANYAEKVRTASKPNNLRSIA
jgi:CDP-glycerol glycerophosphotransferase